MLVRDSSSSRRLPDVIVTTVERVTKTQIILEKERNKYSRKTSFPVGANDQRWVLYQLCKHDVVYFNYVQKLKEAEDNRFKLRSVLTELEQHANLGRIVRTDSRHLTDLEVLDLLRSIKQVINLSEVKLKYIPEDSAGE